MKKVIKYFPNGFTDWLETHYEIVMAIEQQLNNTTIGKAWEVENTQGMGGRYELSEDLTDEFELEYKDVLWGEELIYLDEIEKFIKRELYNQ